MVKDIKVNSGWDVQLDDRNDMPLCEGKDAFEQHIAKLITDYYWTLLGETDRTNTLEKLDLYARRVVSRVSDLERTVSIIFEYSEVSDETIDVTIQYDTGEETTFELF